MSTQVAWRQIKHLPMNVCDYGAVGDGTTDDTDAINAAMAGAPAGGIVYFPPGTYIISSTIDVTADNLTFTGAGWSSVIKAKDNADLVHMVLAYGTGFTMRDIALDGNRDNLGTSLTYGTLLGVSSGALVERVEARYSNRFGIAAGGDDQTDITVKNCYIHHNGPALNPGSIGVGIWVGHYSGSRMSGLKILNNWIEHNHNSLEAGGAGDSGAILLDAVNVLISGNMCIDNFNKGGGQIANLGDPGVGRDWTISDNWVIKTAEFGEAITSGIECAMGGVTVTGNYISGHGNGATGVVVEAIGASNAEAIRIIGNSLIYNTYGVSLFCAGYTSGIERAVIVMANRIGGSTVGIVNDTHAISNVIMGNNLEDNTTPIQDVTNNAVVIGNTPYQTVGNTFSGTITAQHQPRARATHSTTQSIADNTLVPLIWDTEVFDVGAMHSTSSDSSRFVAPEGGLYLATCQVTLAANATGRRLLVIQKNGTTVASSSHNYASGTYSDTNTVTTTVSMNAGEYLEGVAYQNSGGPLNATGGDEYSNMTVVKLW